MCANKGLQKKTLTRKRLMANVFDVAAYILHKQGTMTTMKLQKLVYYAQAWSLVWDEKPLFKNRIEAWANGPVAPTLYKAHRRQFLLSHISNGDRLALTKDEKNTIDAILKHYGNKTPQWLSNLTHAEKPWREARRGLLPTDRGQVEIPINSMYNYYSSL